MTDTTQRIINVISAIPKGKVCSYGNIAKKAGMPNGARQVVHVLHTMTEKYNLPWYRVIRSDGFIALNSGEGRELQTTLLRKEKVKVSDEGKIDLQKYSAW